MMGTWEGIWFVLFVLVVLGGTHELAYRVLVWAMSTDR